MGTRSAARLDEAVLEEDADAQSLEDRDEQADSSDAGGAQLSEAGASTDPKLGEDPALDRRIIEGMLKDRESFLTSMTEEGFSNSFVLRRAAELGLSDALIRQIRGVAADLAGERPGRRPAASMLGARTCLSCDRVFLSTGPGNRLCMRCRGGDAGLAQL